MLCHDDSGGKGRRSRSHKAKDSFGDVVEASFLTSLGQVAFELILKAVSPGVCLL